jgi:hypothetical protein
MSNFQLKEPSSRDGTTQTIAYTASSVAATNPLGSQTYQIRLLATSACLYRIDGSGVTAADDNTSQFLPANMDRVVTVNPGQFIAAIRKGTDGLVTATSGTLSITELS